MGILDDNPENQRNMRASYRKLVSMNQVLDA